MRAGARGVRYTCTRESDTLETPTQGSRRRRDHCRRRLCGGKSAMLYMIETLLTVSHVCNHADSCICMYACTFECMHVHAYVYTHARTRSPQCAHTQTHIHTTQVEHQRRSPWVPWGQFPLLPMGYLSPSRSAPPLPWPASLVRAHSLSFFLCSPLSPPHLYLSIRVDHICVCIHACIHALFVLVDACLLEHTRRHARRHATIRTHTDSQTHAQILRQYPVSAVASQLGFPPTATRPHYSWPMKSLQHLLKAPRLPTSEKSTWPFRAANPGRRWQQRIREASVIPTRHHLSARKWERVMWRGMQGKAQGKM